MFKKILVALDGSDHSRRAAEVAADLALRYDARLVFLTVTRKFKMSKRARAFIEAENLMGEPQYLIDEMTKTILSEAKELTRQRKIKDFDTVVKEGHPARAIVEYAKNNDYDLIVMGSRGIGDLEGALLGSVSHKVTSLAGCTVTIVK